jgi:aspartate aminotransferase
MSSDQEIAGLRQEVADVTKEIIDLISTRNDLAKKIAAAKVRGALPAEDPRVEDALVRVVVRECEEKGVSKQVGLKVLSALLAESKRVQGFQSKQQLITPMMMGAKAQQIEATGRKLLRLDVGEPNFHPPKAVLDATSEALYGFKTHYTGTRGIPALVSAVRAYLERKNRFVAKDTELIVNPGGRFGVYLALSTTVGEGESAIVIEPNWPAYKEGLQYIGGRPISVRTTLEEGWLPSTEAIHDAIRPNTKAIILSYPSNPTGAILPPPRFKEIVDLANDHKLTVISDEIYTDYADKPCPSILGSGAEKFILTASFSKTWAMTGFRVGYTVSSEETISKMMKIQSLLVTCVPEFIQYGAIKALESDSDVIRNSEAMIVRINEAARELDAISALEYVKPDGAMYVFPQAKKTDFDSVAFTMKLLEEKGVTVSPGTGFGDYPRAFRISLGGSDETIVQGIRKIGELLA